MADQNKESQVQSVGGAQKLNLFLNEASNRIKSTTNEKNNSFKAKLLEKSQKYKVTTVIPSEMVQSEYHQTNVQNEPEEDENSLCYSNSENQDIVKPSNLLVSFITRAPEQIATKNQSTFSEFRQALLKKSKTVKQQPASMRLSIFVSNAPDAISKKNTSQFSSFKQRLLYKSKTINDNRKINKPSELIIDFVSKAPENITKASKSSFEEFKKALALQASKRTQVFDNVPEQQQFTKIGNQRNQSNVTNQFSEEGVQEAQVQNLVLNFFSQAPGKIKKRNSDQFKNFYEKLEKQKGNRKSMDLHPKFANVEELQNNEFKSEEFQDEGQELDQINQAITYKMENDRKYKISKRFQAYQQRQYEFLKLQQANQEFVRDLIQRGPQNGKLAEQFQEKAYVIKGDVPQRKILLKNGINIFLPSIKSIRGKNQIVQKQFEEQRYLQQRNRLDYIILVNYNSMPKQGLKAKLPSINQQFSLSEQLQKKMLSEELEKQMIMKYQESRKQLLRKIPQQKQNDDYDYEEEYENQFEQEQEFQEIDEEQNYE